MDGLEWVEVREGGAEMGGGGRGSSTLDCHHCPHSPHPNSSTTEPDPPLRKETEETVFFFFFSTRESDNLQEHGGCLLHCLALYLSYLWALCLDVSPLHPPPPSPQPIQHSCIADIHCHCSLTENGDFLLSHSQLSV